MRKLLIVISLLVIGSGCAFIKPTTQIWVDPSGRFNIYNTKDVAVDLGGVEASRSPDGTATFKLVPSSQPAFTVRDTSSSVINANVGQMLAFVEQQKAATANIEAVMSGLANVVGQLVPLVGGGGQSATAAQGALANVQGLMANLQAAKAQINAATSTACTGSSCAK